MVLLSKDLMIGDWVRVPDLDKYVRVNAVYPTMICPNPHDDDVHPVIGDEYLQPIPLTKEILKRNGWILEWGLEWNNDDAIDLMAKWEDDRFWWFLGDTPVAAINYVHELQHALKLCGIEKEIKLWN